MTAEQRRTEKVMREKRCKKSTCADLVKKRHPVGHREKEDGKSEKIFPEKCAHKKGKDKTEHMQTLSRSAYSLCICIK